MFAELHAVTIRNTVSFHLARQRFDDHGNPHDAAAIDAACAALLAQLGRWARALRTARRTTPYVG